MARRQKSLETRPAARPPKLVPRPQKQAILLAKQLLHDIQGYEKGQLLEGEQAMLKTYAVARGTLREALRILETLGVISYRLGPGGGPVFEGPQFSSASVGLSLSLSIADTRLSEVVDARVAIEPACARMAAANRNDEDLALLQDSLQQQEEALRDEEHFLELNRTCHLLIAAAARNTPLSAMIQSLSTIEDGHAIGVRYSRKALVGVLQAHGRIVAAIEAQDEDEAEASMREHMLEFKSYLNYKYAALAEAPVEWQSA